MGIGCVDYIIGDRFVIPEEHRPLFEPSVVYLPDSYLTYDTTQTIADVSRSDAGLPETAFVFCAYNNTFKLNAHDFDVWMRLLKRVEGSVLWLSGANSVAADNLRREAQARGVDASRLHFAPFVKDVADHLARYRVADLYLDTQPFNAQTTAADALWAGLPVLTQLGSSFVGRAAASLLHALQLPELVTRSCEEYEAMAIRLATDAGLLAGIRNKLALNRSKAPLFNSALFARRIEAAYIAMMERHVAGLPPDHIVVPS
jgi:predicted O-linked N-acetylglucosamine transferase (SPINDLY family)